jgi:hypothetical protein
MRTGARVPPTWPEETSERPDTLKPAKGGIARDHCARDGHRFESPQLREEVRASEGGFRLPGVPRGFDGLARPKAVCVRSCDVLFLRPKLDQALSLIFGQRTLRRLLRAPTYPRVVTGDVASAQSLAVFSDSAASLRLVSLANRFIFMAVERPRPSSASNTRATPKSRHVAASPGVSSAGNENQNSRPREDGPLPARQDPALPTGNPLLLCSAP